MPSWYPAGVVGALTALLVSVVALVVAAGAFHVKVIRPLMHLPDRIMDRATELIEAVLLKDGTEGLLRDLVEEIVAHEVGIVIRELVTIRKRLSAIERQLRRDASG